MVRDFKLDTPIRRDPRAVWRAFEDEVAIVSPATSTVRTLNEVAARCWQLADGRTLGAIVEELVNEFEVDRNELTMDLREFLGQLDQRGLLAAEGAAG